MPKPCIDVMPTSGKALQRAVKLDSIPSNPAAQVALPKARKFRGSYYTPEELKQLFACGKRKKLETVVLLAVKTFGQRSGCLTASKTGSKNRLTDI